MCSIPRTGGAGQLLLGTPTGVILVPGVEGSQVPPSPASGDDIHRERAMLADPWDEAEDFKSIVRPYCCTQGRTRPVQDLAVETLVCTSNLGRDATAITSAEYQAIAGLCDEVRSVAEVAALLGLPLGIARVLLAHMIDMGLVRAYGRPSERGSQPNRTLMARVLAGLHRL